MRWAILEVSDLGLRVRHWCHPRPKFRIITSTERRMGSIGTLALTPGSTDGWSIQRPNFVRVRDARRLGPPMAHGVGGTPEVREY